MSKWTGKSDFCDWCEMHNSPQTIVEKATVYMGHAKLSINKESDLLPYYTNLISSMASNQEGQSIHLTQDSFIDIEEKEFLSTKVYSAIRWKRKADKEKVQFNYKYIQAQKDFWTDELALWNKIISIMNKNPEIAKVHLNKEYRQALRYIEKFLIPEYFHDVHDGRHTRYREQFVKYCSENGYCAFSWNFETCEVGYQNQGEWHPILRDMCFAIADYHKMCKEFRK